MPDQVWGGRPNVTYKELDRKRAQPNDGGGCVYLRGREGHRRKNGGSGLKTHMNVKYHKVGTEGKRETDKRLWDCKGTRSVLETPGHAYFERA